MTAARGGKRNHSMRVLLAFLILAVGAGSARAQSKVDRIDIVEAGIFRAQTATIEYAPDTATRQRNVLSGTKLVAATTRIEAKIGVHFGMRYRLVGRPNNATAKLISITQYPAPGLRNPLVGKPQARGEHSLFATIGTINYRGYVFEHDWELVPGIWTFEIWDGQRKLASQAFEVVRPR
jgi:hypothetical protein